MKKTLQLLLIIGSIALILLVFYLLFEEIFKPSVAVEIVVLASITITAGFGSLDILKNIFAGIMILFDHPFQVGDKISVGNDHGQVIKIGLRSTNIKTNDDSTVIIPNSEVMKKSVANLNYGQSYCRAAAEVILPIDIDTDKIRQIAIEAAQVSSYVFLNKPVNVLFFNEIKDRKAILKMIIKAYVIDAKYEQQFMSDVTELVIKELLARNLITAGDYS